MEKETHIQGAIYYSDNRDYFISLERENLEKIKNGDIIKSKIVYGGSDRDIRNLAQKQIYISLMGDNERRTIMRETKITRTEEKVGLRISNHLLEILLEKPREDYEYRYDWGGNKIHFYLSNDRSPFNEKRGFDNSFKQYEALNKPMAKPEMGDLFESQYIDLNKERKDS